MLTTEQHQRQVSLAGDKKMKTIREVSEIIANCQAASAQCWEMAVETDDSGRNFQSDADECDEAYDGAIEALDGAYDDYIRSVRLHLENARRLELVGGDDQHARRALEALNDLDPAATH